MRLLTTCPWCHEMTDVTGGPTACPACGHIVGVASLVKRPRECKVSRQVALLTSGLIRITANGKAADFAVRPFVSEIGGRAFILAEQGAPADADGPYYVLVAGRRSSCECRGWLRW